jgi:hypothetical protein
MRRYLFAAFATLALMVALPAASLAREHHQNRAGHRDRVERHHGRRDHVEHFRKHGVRHERITPGQPGSRQDIGTVQSFKDDMLVIQLNDGSTVSAKVDRNTEVECETMNDSFQRDDGGPGPSGGDHNRGGDDNGGNDDRGDDNGGDQNGGDDNGSGDDGGNSNCLVALQTAGTGVRDASLSLTSAGPVWDRVDLDS